MKYWCSLDITPPNPKGNAAGTWHYTLKTAIFIPYTSCEQMWAIILLSRKEWHDLVGFNNTAALLWNSGII